MNNEDFLNETELCSLCGEPENAHWEGGELHTFISEREADHAAE